MTISRDEVAAVVRECRAQLYPVSAIEPAAAVIEQALARLTRRSSDSDFALTETVWRLAAVRDTALRGNNNRPPAPPSTEQES